MLRLKLEVNDEQAFISFRYCWLEEKYSLTLSLVAGETFAFYCWS